MPVTSKQYGLGAILKFSEQAAVRAMGRAKGALMKIGQAAQRLKANFQKVGRGLNAIGRVGTVAAAGLGIGIKTAADFESQMSVVGSLSRTIGTKDFKMLEDAAKKSGIVTAFSAKQSAEAMGFLAQAGFDATEIVSALPGVLDMAAAGSLNLARAADINANILRSMGLETKESTRVANVLSLAQARTNTNIEQLGEAYRYAAPVMKMMNVSLEEGTAMLGLMANAGLKGSIAGTAYSNMMLKLIKGNKTATKALAKYNVKLKDSQGNMLPMPQLIANISAGLGKVKGSADKAKIAMALTGLRGIKAFNALRMMGSKSLVGLTTELENSGNVGVDKFGNPIGAAAKQAGERLDNLKGKFTLFGSSMQAIMIESAGVFLGPFSGAIEKATNFLNNITFALMNLQKGTLEPEKRMKILGTTAGQIAQGILEGMNWINDAFKKAKTFIKPILTWFAGLNASTKKFIFFAGIVGTAILAVVGPILLFAGIAAPAISAIAGMFSGLIGIIANPITLVVLGAIIGGLLLMKREGESLWDTFKRAVGSTWTVIKNFFSGFIEAIKPVWEPIKNELIPAIEEWGRTMGGLFDALGINFSNAEGGAEGWGKTFGTMIGGLIYGLTKIITWSTKISSALIGTFTEAGKLLGEWAFKIYDFFNKIINSKPFKIFWQVVKAAAGITTGGAIKKGAGFLWNKLTGKSDSTVSDIAKTTKDTSQEISNVVTGKNTQLQPTVVSRQESFGPLMSTPTENNISVYVGGHELSAIYEEEKRQSAERKGMIEGPKDYSFINTMKVAPSGGGSF